MKTKIQLIKSQYSLADLAEFVCDSICPCHCLTCGQEYEEFLEHDAYGNFYCDDCERLTPHQSILMIFRII
jgi:hypothetical protein